MEQARFQDFMRAFVTEWSLAMSGPASVPLAIIGAFVTNEALKVSLFVTAVVCFVIGSYAVWKRERVKAIAASTRLDIDFVPSGRRFNEIKHNLHYKTRQLSVRVINLGKLQATNCQVYFDGISSNDGNLPKGVALLSAPVALNGSEELFVPIISFEEREHCTAGNLYVPFKINDRKAGYRTFDGSEEHRIILRATAAECGACVREFHFWVDSNHNLLMKRLN